ncbi:MAG TPA: hypothetical protein VE569_11460 [Acidimicrobiia bacterium]|nr:hypothetical protein [Acidimicrobiia bacterium]
MGPVEVQVHGGKQNEQFKLNGLPDTAVREAEWIKHNLDRVAATAPDLNVGFSADSHSPLQPEDSRSG